MRMAIGMGAMLALLLPGEPAAAFFQRDRDAPWCLAYSGRSGILECAYATFEQCLETTRGAGGSCQPNFNTRYTDRGGRKRKRRDR